MSVFEYEIGQEVLLVGTADHGKIVGRAQYEHDENKYLIRYKALYGKLVEEWWCNSALTPYRV